MPAAWARWLVAAALVGLVASCGGDRDAPAPPPPTPGAAQTAPETPAVLSLTPARFADLPGWTTDDQAQALPALRRSCERIAAVDPARPVGPEGVSGKAGDWRVVCTAAAQVPANDAAAARRFFETRFQPWRAADRDQTEGLFTGYYEPLLSGSRTRTQRFSTPLLRRPPDLVEVDLAQFRPALRGQRIAGRLEGGRLRPYPDRAEIEAGALQGRGLELVWVDDAVDAFFLHIQGSGRVKLTDGTVLRVGYEAQNGHAYVPIGRLLADRGQIPRESVSMPSIRAWLAAHPAEAGRLMNENPSYVFFRELKGDGPLGAQGVALTPGRSLAVDPSFVPYGVPVWLDAEDPLSRSARVRRLMVAQDTGGAIRGPVRGDVFWGFGAEAAERAGLMKSRGGYWLLLPQGVRPPQAR
ncbi:membrane-bound lytic murein transglycosylase A [Stella humosa]|uniref:peptidoglycan lytic exotransglycosylase n=1 Tax=Stella humosa TaxID=94 RepID=A0A3N1LJI4_9PROT|nr:MltA domain-containing protein [Stella humosa]ROP90969.1 membrane-bound lytic murein transglycosylase A [Stella humosa]BBK34681.1 murein transglycosylase [Stella humosa]